MTPTRPIRSARPKAAEPAAAPAAPRPAPASAPGTPTLRRDVFYCAPPKPQESTLPTPFLCIVCARQISGDKPPTMTVEHKGRDWLYVAHEQCWTGITDREKRVFDSTLRRLLREGAT